MRFDEESLESMADRYLKINGHPCKRMKDLAIFIMEEIEDAEQKLAEALCDPNRPGDSN